MGHTTDFVGNLTVAPRLNDTEIEFLNAFATSRRCRRPGGPYDVPGNPGAGDWRDFPTDLDNLPATGQPGLWCNWEVCWEGDCLCWNGTEKSYRMVEWLRYLIEHFLKPGAKAQPDPRFSGFTFDHVVSGMVVGCRRDTKELFAVRVTDNRVRTRVLQAGNPAWAAYPDLPYEVANDRWQPRRRRRTPPAGGTVIPLRDRP
jgi:hypothetical protein